MKQKIAVLFDNLGPYHVARLKACTQSFTVLAIEHRSTSKDYAWVSSAKVPFERVTLIDGGEHDKISVRRRLEQTLESFQPTAIAVPGWANWLAISAIRWAYNAAVPVVVMSDSQEIDYPRVFWKEAGKKGVLRFYHAALVAGQSHLDYLTKLGMSRAAISLGYDVVDNAYFAAESERIRERAGEWRVQLKLPDRYFLCTARFIAKKNLPLLLRAYRRYLDLVETRSPMQRPWALVILGDGAERAAIEAAIRALNLTGQVHLPGFRQIEEMPAFYALASVFILPSTTEQWGLVVNEAMAAGLPVLVSSRCGCARHLVHEGKNGFTFDPRDIEGLSQLMMCVASDECDRDAMGRASREIIAPWSPETFAEGLLRAVWFAQEAPQRRVSFFDRLLLWGMSLKGGK